MKYFNKASPTLARHCNNLRLSIANESYYANVACGLPSDLLSRRRTQKAVISKANSTVATQLVVDLLLCFCCNMFVAFLYNVKVSEEASRSEI